jgi:hypothetical protein
VLHAKGRDAVTDEVLKSLQAAIEAVLRDMHGTDVCKSSRLLSRTSPELNSQDSVWVLSGTAQDRMFWHWQCHNFQAHSRESYELTIRVTRADPHGEKSGAGFLLLRVGLSATGALHQPIAYYHAVFMRLWLILLAHCWREKPP